MDNRPDNKLSDKLDDLSLEKKLVGLFADIPTAYASPTQPTRSKYVYQLNQLFSDEPFNLQPDGAHHQDAHHQADLDRNDPPQELAFLDDLDPLTIDLSPENFQKTAELPSTPTSAPVEPEGANVAQTQSSSYSSS